MSSLWEVALKMRMSWPMRRSGIDGASSYIERVGVVMSPIMAPGSWWGTLSSGSPAPGVTCTGT